MASLAWAQPAELRSAPVIENPREAVASGAEPAPAADSIDLWTLYQEAVLADPRLLAAEARALSGRGRKREAYGQLLPQLTASASATRTARDDGRFREFYNGERYALSLNQALFDAGAWRSYKRFTALAEQAKSEYADVKTQVTVDLVERYFAALAAEDELALVQAERRATQRNLDRVESLYERQMAMVTDVLEISARVDSLIAEEIEAQNQVAVAREALSEVVGFPVLQPLHRIGRDAQLAMPDREEQFWVQMALERNSALAARQDAVEAAEAALREGKAGHLPTVSLFATAQESDIGYENTLVPQTETYVVGVGIQIPLFSGGSVSARVTSLYGALTEAQQNYEAVRREVVKETRTAFMSTRASVSKVSATEKALLSALRAREAAEKAFGYGVNNAVDVLNAVREEYSARRDYLQSQYSFIMGWLVLNRWGGTLDAEQVQEANAWLHRSTEQAR